MYREVRPDGSRGPETVFDYTSGNAADFTPARGLIPGNKYGFLVVASKNPPNPYVAYSNNAWSDTIPSYGQSTGPNCNPPTVTTFTLTSGSKSTSPGNAPLPIKQTEPLNINWNVTNAQTCTASVTSNPGSETLTPAVSNAWLANPKPLSGSHSFGVNQITSIGTYNFTLTCTNPWNNAITAQPTVVLTVEQLREPYIEFQGDFHTNESVNIE
jgi:hypothetical protein